MAARDAVKRVPEIARNHCPSSAKCARQGIAGSAAFRVMVDHDVGHALAPVLAPSALPISLSFCFIAISSMLECGSVRNSEMRLVR